MSGYVLHPEAYTDIDDIWESSPKINWMPPTGYEKTFTRLLANSCRFRIRATGVPTSPQGLYGS